MFFAFLSCFDAGNGSINTGMSILFCFFVHRQSLSQILTYTPACFKANAQYVICVSILLSSRYAKSFYSFGIALLNTLSLVIENTKIVLCVFCSLLGGFLIPFCGLSGILRNTASVLIAVCKISLRVSMSLFRCFTEQKNCFGVTALLVQKESPTIPLGGCFSL